MSEEETAGPIAEFGRVLTPWQGAVCGLLAAIGYTATNAMLRLSVGQDAFLVSAGKAVPTLLGTLPILLWMSLRGAPIVYRWSPLPGLLAGIVIGQFIGNVLFQVALEYVGLAITVPICLGTLIIGSAVFGHLWLGERVTRRKVYSMLVLVLAIVLLSLSGRSTQRVAVENAGGVSIVAILTGVLAASLSGFGYSVFGTMMRRSLRGGISVPAAMFLSGLIGATALSGVTLYRIGFSGVLATPIPNWAVMFAAGAFNFIAFFLILLSLKAIPVVAVNMLNASQAAMAAVVGVLFFHEPLTGWLVVGLLLTIAGLAILNERRPRAAPVAVR